jgi:hypothetical protein
MVYLPIPPPTTPSYYHIRTFPLLKQKEQDRKIFCTRRKQEEQHCSLPFDLTVNGTSTTTRTHVVREGACFRHY